jgi:hypothetical protein
MKTNSIVRFALAAMIVGTMTACSDMGDIGGGAGGNSGGGGAGGGGSEPTPPAKPLDVNAVTQAITKTTSETRDTTIYSNVLNLSGGSCVNAATKRGEAIGTTLQGMKAKGDIPADHSIKVYTYSGYRVPGIDYGSLHTCTVTQISDGAGKPVSTWTADNYLGPTSVKQYPGDGGYGNWNDPLTNPVAAPAPVPAPSDTSVGDSGKGGGGGSGHGD